jgi:hypothetical protein
MAALKIEAVCSFEIYKIIRRYNPEDQSSIFEYGLLGVCYIEGRA